jgi:uncharacterized phage protein (TIGR02216 family)
VTFAESAGRLAGMVPRVLGWRPGEFWDATPAELAAILAPGDGLGGEPLDRSEMTALMERDHG